MSMVQLITDSIFRYCVMVRCNDHLTLHLLVPPVEPYSYSYPDAPKTLGTKTVCTDDTGMICEVGKWYSSGCDPCHSHYELAL